MKTIVAALSLFFCSAALAQQALPAPSPADVVYTRRFGGCSRAGLVCAGPTVSVALVGYDLSTKKLQTGIMPGLGYGVNLWANKWHTVGIGVYAAIRQTEDSTTNGMFSFLVSFAEYVRLGIARDVTSATDVAPARGSWVVLGGFGADFR